MFYMATLISIMSKVRDIHATGYRLIGLLVALHLIAFSGWLLWGSGRGMAAVAERQSTVDQ